MSELKEAAKGVLDIDSEGAGESSSPRKRGRPKGSKNRTRVEEDSEPTREPYQPNESSIVMCSVLGNVIWNITRRFTGWSGLSPEEKESLGQAIDPLLYKYVPIMDKWKEELTFVVCVGSLVTARLDEKKPEKVEEGIPENSSPIDVPFEEVQ